MKYYDPSKGKMEIHTVGVGPIGGGDGYGIAIMPAEFQVGTNGQVVKAKDMIKAGFQVPRLDMTLEEAEKLLEDLTIIVCRERVSKLILAGNTPWRKK